MATYTRTLSGSSSYQLRLTVEQISQNIQNNTSTVSYRLQVVFSGSSGSWARHPYYANYNVKIDGTTIASGQAEFDFRASSTITFAQGTRTIVHQADGTKSVNVSGYWTDNGHTSIGSGTASGTLALTAIPRSTVPSVSPGTVSIGETLSISLPRADSTWTHDVFWEVGSLTGQVATGVGSSTSWTLPLSLLHELKDTELTFAYIIVRTYSGSTLIGEQRGRFSVWVPHTYAPTISSVQITDAIAQPSGISAYVQHKSRLRIRTTASGRYSATITRVAVKVDGIDYTGADITSHLLTKSGSISIEVTVTDSRGKSTTHNQTVTVQPYSAPSISRFTTVRSLSNGTIREEGTFSRSEIRWDVASISTQNTMTYELQYHTAGDATWTTLHSGSSPLSFNGALMSSEAILNPDLGYEFRITVTDKFSSVFQISTIDPVGAAFAIKANKKGVSFGKLPTLDEAVDSAWIGLFPEILLAGGPVDERLTEMTFFGTVADKVSNWDDLSDVGVYDYGGGAPSTNGPGMYGKALVWGKGMYRVVMVIGPSEIRFRLRTESGWRPWRKIASTAV